MLIILISVEVKMGATHSLGSFLRSYISSDFSPFKLHCLLFNREMQFYPSGHFWLLIGVLNSFPSKESKRKKIHFAPSLADHSVSLGPLTYWEEHCSFCWVSLWPSSSQLIYSSPWTSGSLWEGQEKCLSCVHPCIVLMVRWEEMYTKALWKWRC